MNKLIHLLSKGENIAIFPEGTRSRSGKVDTENFTYGVGGILHRAPDAKVLCVYLRGRNQETYSDFPQKGDRFYVDLDLIKTESEYQGLRAARDLSRQVVHHLSEMEQRYFENFVENRK